MLESLLTTLDQFTPEILVIMAGLLVITSTLFLWLWFANRRTYQLLKHQIPASVVKTYLDSIIQNSTSLKSSLFRGGGDELAAAIPSVFPTINLGGGDNISLGGGNDSALREQLNQRLGEIASLQSQLATGNGTKKDLEKSLADAIARIKELEAMLAKGSSEPAKGSSDPGLAAEMQKIAKERDDLREKLKEYEIIEDDLANLKRLQQENLQLRKALEAQGGNVAAVTAIAASPAAATPETSAPLPAATPAARSGHDPLPGASDIFEELPTASASADEVSTTAELEQFLGSDEPTPEATAAPAAEASAEEANPENKPATPEKTPEDLLSEFEKMLG